MVEGLQDGCVCEWERAARLGFRGFQRRPTPGQGASGNSAAECMPVATGKWVLPVQYCESRLAVLVALLLENVPELFIMLQVRGAEAHKLVGGHAAGAHDEVLDALDLLCTHREGTVSRDSHAVQCTHRLLGYAAHLLSVACAGHAVVKITHWSSRRWTVWRSSQCGPSCGPQFLHMNEAHVGKGTGDSERRSFPFNGAASYSPWEVPAVCS